MYNEKLVDDMIREFGLNRTIGFAEMVSFMYKKLSEEPNSNPENGYEHTWWKNKFEQLKHNVNERLDGKVSVVYEAGKSLV